MNISEMLARNSRLYPNNIALIERTPSKGVRKQVTWKQFDDDVNKIANALLAKGIKKGDRVLHWMMNSILWLEVYFGILRTGAWATPLNFRFTSQDLKYCIDIAEPKAIIFDEEFIEKVEAIRFQPSPINSYIVVGENVSSKFESFFDLMSESINNPIGIELNDEDPSGLYFTSGTTGPPKPILLTHKNLECGAIIEVAHGLRKFDDIFMILKPLYHTGDKIHWLSSLILGAPAVIQRGMITPKEIFEAIHEERGTVIMLLVPWIRDILTALEKGDLRREDYDLRCLRVVIFGAQPVPSNLVKLFQEKFPCVKFDVLYGLTEATGPGCIHLGIGNERKLGSVGKAGFNWEARIVNEKGEDVNIGVVGEIIVKGNGVMKEYYKNPEKTAETIRKGWLYTGDMGKFDEEGFIWIVDRKKDVIISGGENIYPVEIEEFLHCHPKIKDVAVIGFPDDRLGEIAIAIIELSFGILPSNDTEREINLFCEENLPRYKRPKVIIFDKVLRNLTGKIDKVEMRKKYSKTKIQTIPTKGI